MAKCRKCGAEAYPRRTCRDCLIKFQDKRQAAFNQAVAELGTLTADNLTQIQRRVKELEKE